MSDNKQKSGFTLAEVIIASFVVVIAVAMCMVGFVYVIKSANQNAVQQELDTQVQNSMERLKYDLRLSTLNNKYMFFWPIGGTQAATAISFPIAGTNGAGGVLVDTNGNIIWTQQKVYHILTSTPNELLVTTFNPQPTNMSASQFQGQLASVVSNGNGYSSMGSSSATTQVLFANLLTWTIDAQPGTFDGYASALGKQTITLGNTVLSNGNHSVQFTVVGKNTNSTGYAVGIDQLYVSPSHSIREGETQVVTASSGATPVWRDMTGNGSWANNADLSFPATATNQSFTLQIYDDKWEETTFGETGHLFNNGSNSLTTTQIYFDTNMSPKDFVVKLAGNNTAWMAYQQTQDPNGVAGESSSSDQSGRAMRVLIRGGAGVTNGGWLISEGSKCKIQFAAAANALHIQAARIGVAGSAGCSPDAAPGTSTNLTFGGSASVTVNANSNVWSDYEACTIRTTNSYLVTYLVTTNNAPNTAWKWSESTWADNVPGSYEMTNGASTSWTNDVWSTNANVALNQYIRGVQAISVSYMSNGYYQSQIFDTQNTAPVYHQMAWTASTPSGTTLGMQIRTGNQPNLSDALQWSATGQTASPWPMGAGGRYAQFLANLVSDNSCLTSPELQSVTVDWPGVNDAVDVGGTFTQGTNYGIFQVLVDGNTLKRGLILNLSIYKWARAYGGGSNLMSSSLSEEVQPWNTTGTGI